MPFRPVRFSLRTLLIVMTLSGAGLGIYHGYVRPYQIQHAACAALAETRKEVVFEWRPAKPAWLRSMIGLVMDEEVLRDCVMIRAERCNINDKDLVHLREMPRLQRLYLASNPITDEGLKHLRELQQLERLSLWGTKITDSGVKLLGGLSSLQVLDIHDPFSYSGSLGSAEWKLPLHWRPKPTKGVLTSASLLAMRDLLKLRGVHFSFTVDNKSLAVLASLPKLRIRTLIVPEVNDESIAHLARLGPHLETLVIQGGTLGPNGLAPLAACGKLKHLWLENVTAPSSEWRHLGQLKQLERLSLEGSTIQDSGLRHGAGLVNLQQLELKETDITSDGVRHLSGLTRLQRLSLPDKFISSDSLRNLTELEELRILRVKIPLDDRALEYLSRLPELQQLDYQANYDLYVTDAGLSSLAKLRCPRNVNLYDADDGFAAPRVDVPPNAGAMTDRGLQELLSRRAFHMVTIYGRKITVDGIDWSEPSQGNTHRMVTLQTNRSRTEVFGDVELSVSEAELLHNQLEVRLGEDRHSKSITVRLGSGSCDLEVLRHLPKLKTLKVTARTSNARLQGGWKNLRFVPELESLECHTHADHGFELDADGVRLLGEMQHLKQLICDVRKAMPATFLVPLGKAPQLESLDIWGGALSEQNLEALSQISTLKELRIFGFPRSVRKQASLRHLSRLKNLNKLWLYGCSDEGLEHVAQCRELVRLSVSGKQVTDAGLKKLLKLPKLQYLDARSTSTSDRVLYGFRGNHANEVHVRTDRPKRP